MLASEGRIPLAAARVPSRHDTQPCGPSPPRSAHGDLLFEGQWLTGYVPGVSGLVYPASIDSFLLVGK